MNACNAETAKAILSTAVLVDDPGVLIRANWCPTCGTFRMHLYMSATVPAHPPGGAPCGPRYGSFCVCKTCSSASWYTQPYNASLWLASVSARQLAGGRL